MMRYRRNILGWSLVWLLLAPSVYAQAPTDNTADQQLTPQQETWLKNFFAERQECFKGYHFGSVEFNFDEDYNSGSYPAGAKIAIKGTITNKNDYPFSGGVIFARLLRHDDNVADDNWHPIVLEQDLPGKYDLPKQGTLPFKFDWQVPDEAPAGIYRLELSYFAGKRYVISGIPYVANFPGGSTIFSITNDKQPNYAYFDISTIRLNNTPYHLRSVPPTFKPGQPLKANADLKVSSKQPVALTLHSALYAWSDTDHSPPVWERTSHISVAPGQTFPAQMLWDKPAAGAYELVMKATPDDSDILPSMVKIRFPIEGNVPRVIYSGIGGIENGEAIITTCTVNGTYDDPLSVREGQVSTVIKSASGEVLGTATTSTTTNRLMSSSATVPLSKIGRALAVSVVAKDDMNTVTDSNVTSYPSTMLVKSLPWFWIVMSVILILVIIAILLIKTIIKRQQEKHPEQPITPAFNPPL